MSDTTDYIGVRNVSSSHSVLIHPDNDTIWIYGQSVADFSDDNENIRINRPNRINQNNYVFINGITERDSVFFYKKIRSEPTIIKKPYIKISVIEYFNGICLKNAGDSIYNKLKSL
ncbi:MAG TPA: hypothetical protein DIT04_10625 [Dysgonomonas sp.]|nr:hypothetical protein [Dysgonomonas sp.]